MQVFRGISSGRSAGHHLFRRAERQEGRYAQVQTALVLATFDMITASTLNLTCLTAQVVKGIVLRTFGAGNAPDNNPDFLAALKSANDMGIVIINTTQCMRTCSTVQAVVLCTPTYMFYKVHQYVHDSESSSS